MNRRHFLQLLGAGMAGTAMPLQALGDLDYWLNENDLIRLTLLHTNDTHSRLEPFPESDPKYGGKGGVAGRYALIEQIRRENKGEILLLDSGDIFQGTPYFNVFGGEPELKCMSMMGYDASTIGNHDLDNGIEGLNRMLPFATFPFVNCNYELSNTPLSGKVPKRLILKKNNLKIGITGVGVAFEGLVSPIHCKDAEYLDPVQSINREAEILKEDEKCDLVILLSHLGYEYKSKNISDLSMSGLINNVDIILGGHTHTFLETPTVALSKKGNTLLINQVGWAGLVLGRMDLIFERGKGWKGSRNSKIEISKKTIDN
jgi:5'-nucleotidase